MHEPRPDPIFEALQVDVERTRRKLPEELRCLADVVWNFAWSWLPGGVELFRDIDGGLWEASRHNPRSVLEGVGPQRLSELGADPHFPRRAAELAAALQAYLEQPVALPAERVLTRYGGRPVAYFSAEFGLHESLPIYS